MREKHFCAFACFATQINADYAMGSPLAFSGEAIDTQYIGSCSADAAALNMEPVERSRRVRCLARDPEGVGRHRSGV